jgi:hypothetical protein
LYICTYVRNIGGVSISCASVLTHSSWFSVCVQLCVIMCDVCAYQRCVVGCELAGSIKHSAQGLCTVYICVDSMGRNRDEILVQCVCSVLLCLDWLYCEVYELCMWCVCAGKYLCVYVYLCLRNQREER